MKKYFLYTLIVFASVPFTSCEEAKPEETPTETVELAKQFQLVDELLNHLQSGKIQVKESDVETVSSLFDGTNMSGSWKNKTVHDGFEFSSEFVFAGNKLDKVFYDFFFHDTTDSRINEDFQVLLKNISNIFSDPSDSSNDSFNAIFYWDENHYELALELFNNGYSVTVRANKASLEIDEIIAEVKSFIGNTANSYQLGVSTKEDIQKLHATTEEGGNLILEKDFGTMRSKNTFVFNPEGQLVTVESNYYFNKASIIRSNTDMNILFDHVYMTHGEPDVFNPYSDGNSYLWKTEFGELELNGFDDGYGFVFKTPEAL